MEETLLNVSDIYYKNQLSRTVRKIYKQQTKLHFSQNTNTTMITSFYESNLANIDLPQVTVDTAAQSKSD